jgi:hypothetical protein
LTTKGNKRRNRRLDHHAKVELENKIAEIQEYVRFIQEMTKYKNTRNGKPFLSYVWSNILFSGNMEQAYTQSTRISLTQEEEVLRGSNNTPLLPLQERKPITRERTHDELITDHDTMYSYKDALVNGGQPNYVRPNIVPVHYDILEALPDSHEILSNHTQESLTKQLREEQTISSAGCIKSLLDTIDNSILQLPDFARYVTAKNPIDLYRSLKEKFLIATNTDITSTENALNAVICKKMRRFKTLNVDD